MIVAIDPGKSGGVAVLTRMGDLVDCTRMPMLVRGKKRECVDTAVLSDLLRKLRPPEVGDLTTVLIELVGAMPGQGVTSMFNFGRHTGSVEGWALGQGCAVDWVTPAQWKGGLGFPTGAKKQASLDRARMEFGPDDMWKVKANDGIAEAALMGLWWLRNRGIDPR